MLCGWNGGTGDDEGFFFVEVEGVVWRVFVDSPLRALLKENGRIMKNYLTCVVDFFFDISIGQNRLAHFGSQPANV